MKNKLITRFHVKKNTIYLRVTINGERTEISTNKKINPVLWNKSLQRIKGHSDVNKDLNALLSKVEKQFSSLDIDEKFVSLTQVMNALKGIGVNQMTLFKAYDIHIANITKLIGTEYMATTIKRYKTSYTSLKRFMKDTDVKLCDLDYKFIETYYTHIRQTDGLKHNSATNIIKNLYRVINMAVNNNWLTISPFRNFSCNYVNPVRQYLTETEIDSLVNKVFEISRLAKVRDVFVFQIYTGLSYIDMQGLTTDNIEVGVDGNKWIVINRQKTGVRSAIPILPRAMAILERYDYILPVYANQKMNSYLKEIADLCNIKKPLTTHIGRHTFATTITLSQGVPIETVSKMLGHTDIRTTQIYAKITDRKTANDMKGLI